METSALPAPSPIVKKDLIPDRALKAHDRDEFEYGPIADRLADLCCKAEAPINIALFAPWGSGKSSLATLIDASLRARPNRTKLIRYDAWLYGGKGLRRNFIAHAARELHLPEDDPRYAKFHRGLYENKRRVSLSAGRAWREIRDGKLGPLLVVLVAALALGLFLSVAAVIVAAGISVFLTIVTAIVNSGKVEVEESKPSEDEEFSERFDKLIELATDDGEPPDGAIHRLRNLWRQGWRELAETTGFYRLWMWWTDEIPATPLPSPRFERLIFFIDELDRCSREDIVETLKALRTFLDARRCVFLVAADRDVIEAALAEVEQTTPINEEMPYYTTAGAYLDKIFQHQIALPPLRSRSLAKFAHRMAIEAGGIWRELAEIDAEDGATPALDQILFVLVPSHVRSPRRIKVLLNNYATNVRMARSRLPDVWPQRAAEVARLTAFQTEFADFAADLRYEPRLPRYLLDGEDAPENEAIEALLIRWSLESEESEGPDEAPADPDPFMVSLRRDDDEAREHALLEAELRRRRELRRYLERTHAVVGDLRRDLFYLQSAGLDVGLEDPELAELIEAEATDSPQRVIEALQGRPREQLEGAARLLGSMVGEVLGPEQAGVMSCLMEAVTMLGDDGAAVARDVAGALRTYWTGNSTLAEEHLVGALRTAISVRPSDPPLAGEVIADDRLWEDASRVASVVPMAPRLRDDELRRLRGGLAAQMPGAASQLLAAVAELAPAEKLRLMDSGEVFGAFGEALDRVAEEEPEEAAEGTA